VGRSTLDIESALFKNLLAHTRPDGAREAIYGHVTKVHNVRGARAVSIMVAAMSFVLWLVIGVYMCLAIPAEVTKVEGNKGVVDYGGLEQEISLDLVEDVHQGDYVLIHVGFAIEKLSKEAALETLAIFKELEEFEQENA